MKTFPIALRSIPVYLGGLNLRSIEVEAIAQSIHHLISLYIADTPSKLLLKTIIEYHQLELGTDTQLFSLSYASFGALATSTWITNLWQHACNFCLLITLLPLQMNIVKQEGDDFINDVVLRLNFPVDQREAINRVRIHLQLLLILDLLIYKKEYNQVLLKIRPN